MRTTTRRYTNLDDLPPFCSAEDVAEVLRVSRATLYRMVGQGRIPCIRLGRRVIFSREHLKNWLDREIGGRELWQDV